MARRPRQREAILDVFRALARPLSAQEACAAAREKQPGLGMATAYRAVHRLCEEGVLRPVELPGEATRYEVADSPHHHFFHCRGCDHVYPISGCPGDLKRLAPRGFVVDAHEVLLYGQCPDCVKPT